MFVWETKMYMIKHRHRDFHMQESCFPGTIHLAVRICPSLENLLIKCTLFSQLVKKIEKSKCLWQPSLSCQFLAKCITPVYILQLCPSTNILPLKWPFQGKTEKALLWDRVKKSFACKYIKKNLFRQILLGCFLSHVPVNLFTYIYGSCHCNAFIILW